MQSLKGLATGIGSLPHQNTEEALDLIFKYVPNIPFWPQLPKRDFREGMISQFSENIPCLGVSKDSLIFNPAKKEEELELFYERIIGQDLDYFKINPDFASGLYRFCQRLGRINLDNIEYIKCQITGPFTFAASIKDENGKALLHDTVLMQTILKGLTMKALWQINFFKQFAKKMIIFLDEPYLGCFGSAYTPINREDVVKNLSELTVSLKSQGALVGIHCCGNTDWSMFTQLESIDIVNFDAVSFLDRFLLYADSLKKFLERGGIICWGIAPTQEFSGKEEPGFFLGKLEYAIEQLAKKGISRSLLSERLLVSPACGLGALDPEKAEAIFGLLAKISQEIRSN
ncbi:methionine synthase [bacterium]|nr:MAG: methionine synthase [bacterium]